MRIGYFFRSKSAQDALVKTYVLNGTNDHCPADQKVVYIRQYALDAIKKADAYIKSGLTVCYVYKDKGLYLKQSAFKLDTICSIAEAAKRLNFS